MDERWRAYLHELQQLKLEVNRELDNVQVRELPRLELIKAMRKVDEARRAYVGMIHDG